MTAKRRNQLKGFTLIELMVAITIIAILSAIGLTIFSQAQSAARDGKRQGDLQETQKALEQYYAVNRTYPAANSLVSGIAGLSSYYQSTTPPSDPNPPSGFDYHYYACSAPAGYKICARMENCTGKCNENSAPTDGCGQVGSFGSGSTFYCLRGISN